MSRGMALESRCVWGSVSKGRFGQGHMVSSLMAGTVS